MKVIKNRDRRFLRKAVINRGMIKALKECAICGLPLTRTFFVCDPCIEKHFTDEKRQELSSFIDDIVLKSIVANDLLGVATLPSWVKNPNEWFEGRIM